MHGFRYCTGGDIWLAATDIAPAAPEITSALIVDATLWILIGFSVVTWALILIKGIQHLRISHHNRIYGKKFWGAQDFQAAAALEGNKGPAARVADVGFTTLIEADGGTTTHDLEHTGDRQELAGQTPAATDAERARRAGKRSGHIGNHRQYLAICGLVRHGLGNYGRADQHQ